MITLTDNAVKAVKRFIRFSEQPFIGVRIAVASGGCSGFQYEIDMTDEERADDAIMEVSGIKILVDNQSASLVEGLTIDFKETMVSSGFVFDNPNATGSCGCGKSFTV